MKRLLLAPLLLLSACAPALNAVQQEAATLRREGQSVVFANPGPGTALAPTLLLVGDIVTADPLCNVRSPRVIGCRLPDVEAGKQYRLTYTGSVRAASVTFYRAASGGRPIYLELP